jgi:BRCT domain type II-containing protein
MGPAKLEKAQKLKIKIMDEEEFLELLKVENGKLGELQRRLPLDLQAH